MRQSIKNIFGFTLIEILVYSGLFAVSAMLLIGILFSVTRVGTQEEASAEVSSQSGYILQTISRLVSDASLVEVDPASGGKTLWIYKRDYASDANKTKITYYPASSKITLKEGLGAEADLITSKVKVDNLNFSVKSNQGGHDVVQINMTMSYNSPNAAQAFSRVFSTTVARVSAATFDSGLYPGSPGWDVGGASSRWANGYFSNADLSMDLTVGGNVLANGANSQIGVNVPSVISGTRLEVGAGGYFQFDKISSGAPPASDCDAGSKRGRMVIDTINNRLYICNGQVRGWDFVPLND